MRFAGFLFDKLEYLHVDVIRFIYIPVPGYTSIKRCQRFFSFLAFAMFQVFKREFFTYRGVSMVSLVVPGTARVPPCPEGDCP